MCLVFCRPEICMWFWIYFWLLLKFPISFFVLTTLCLIHLVLLTAKINNWNSNALTLYSGQFCKDIMLQLENDFIQSLKAEVSIMSFLLLNTYANLSIHISFFLVLSVFLIVDRLMMCVKWKLLDLCLGIQGNSPGTWISRGCNLGKTKHLRGRLSKSFEFWWTDVNYKH